MQIKDVVNILNTFNVNVVFDTRQDVVNRIIQGTSTLLYFTPIDGKEKIKYEKCKNKTDFISSTPTIHIPDLTIRELVNTFECDVGNTYDTTKQMISQFNSTDIPQDVVFVAFLFLHEVGHWVQFANMGNRVYEFVNTDIEVSKDNYEKMQKAQQKRAKRIRNNGDSCLLTVNEKATFKKLSDEYRKIPKEKNADDFALSQMEQALNLLREKNN